MKGLRALLVHLLELFAILHTSIPDGRTKVICASQYQDMDMFPSLEGTKGAVEAFPHSAAAMEPAGADAEEEDEPKEAAPAPEPAAITA